MINAFKFIILSILFPIMFFSCGGSTEENRVETGKLQPVEVFIQGVGLNVMRVAFNADGSRILTSGANGTTLWDVGANKELKTVSDKEAYSMAASKSGRYLLTYSPADAGKIQLFDFSTSTTRSLQVLSPEASSPGDYITGFSITDDEKRFVLETGNIIRVFDIETLAKIGEIPLKESHYLFNYRRKGMSFIPGTNDFLTISYDIAVSEPDVIEEGRDCQFLISVYDLNSQEPKFNYSLKSKFIYSWAVSGDGKKLALLFMDKRVQIIDLLTGGHSDHTIEADGEVTVLGFTDDTNLTFAGREGIVGTYDCERDVTRILETGLRAYFMAPSCVDLAVANNGRTIAFCSGYERLIVYDLPSNEIKVFGDPANPILGTYFDEDALVNVLTPARAYKQNGSNVGVQEYNVKKLVSIFADQVRMEDPQSGGSQIFDASIAKTIYSGTFEDEKKQYASFTQDGKYAFYWKRGAPDGDPDRNLYVARLDDASLPPVRLENTDRYGGNIRVFDDNSKAIMSGFATDLLGIWDIRTGKLIDTLNEQSGNARAFEFLDRTKCLIGTRGNVKLYDLSNGRVLKKFTPSGYYGDNRDIEKIVLARDKKRFATADAWGLVTIWDLDKEHEVASFQTHKDWITSLGFSGDGNSIVSASYNGKSAVVSNVSTGKELVKFVSFTDGEWILITPEGYFNASENGAKYLNVRIGASVYSIDNFYEKFYNPSYVASVLRGKNEEKVADIRKGFTLPPQVKITSPSPGTEFKSDALTISVAAKDMGGGIDEIRLYQNGKVVSEDQRGMKSVGAVAGSLAKSYDVTTSYDASKTYEVTLLPGVNTFRAVAFNRERTESNPDEITVELKAAQAASDLYLFAIGINEYKNGKYNLNYGKSDAAAFGKAVAGRSKTIFRTIVHYQLYDGDATRPAIEAVFRTIAAAAKPQDAFVFYYAGHGVMSEGSGSLPSDFYLIPTDVTQLYGDDAILSAKAISAAQLKTFCTTISAQKQLVVLDACQSGGALASFSARGASEERAIMQLARSAGTVLLASTGTEQFATEFSALSHGVFTYALLQGLNGEADGGNPKDGKITVKELEAYLNDRVPELTKKYRGTAQYPNSFARGQDFPLGVK